VAWTNEEAAMRHPTRAACAAIIFFALLALTSTTRAADTFTYDPEGRLASVTYENGVMISYTYDPNGNIIAIITSIDPTGVEETPAPIRFALGAAKPNPGSGPREIPFSIPTSGHATLRVFDVSGRLLATLLDRDLPAGRYSARFGSERLPAGVCFYRLELGGRALTGRLVTLR